MLWHATPVDGLTLNAVVFHSIIASFGWHSSLLSAGLLAVVLALEAGLLVVGAQTGFLDGPTVLSNMAADSWVPRHFRDLSSRLVRQNGIVVMGLSSLAILAWTGGQVDLLVVLYSINVFLTFSLSLLGMCIYWWRQRKEPGWFGHFGFSALGLMLTSSVLVITTYEKFGAGGWLTVVVTGIVVGLCILTKRHYDETRKELGHSDAAFAGLANLPDVPGPEVDPAKPTAVLFVGKHLGANMHTLLWVPRLFPNHFKNYVFLAVGEVDAQSFEGHEQLERLRATMEKSLGICVAHCHRHGLAARYEIGFGTDPVEEFTKLSEKVMRQHPSAVCFATKLIFVRVNMLTRWLHNQTPLTLQTRLHLSGHQMVLLPMRIE